MGSHARIAPIKKIVLERWVSFQHDHLMGAVFSPPGRLSAVPYSFTVPSALNTGRGAR